MTWHECEDDKKLVDPNVLAQRLSEKSFWSDKDKAMKYIKKVEQHNGILIQGNKYAKF